MIGLSTFLPSLRFTLGHFILTISARFVNLNYSLIWPTINKFNKQVKPLTKKVFVIPCLDLWPLLKLLRRSNHPRPCFIYLSFQIRYKILFHPRLHSSLWYIWRLAKSLLFAYAIAHFWFHKSTLWGFKEIWSCVPNCKEGNQIALFEIFIMYHQPK